MQGSTHTHKDHRSNKTDPQGESTASHNTPSSVEMFDQTDHIKSYHPMRVSCRQPHQGSCKQSPSCKQLCKQSCNRHQGWADKELRGSRRQSLSIDQPSRRREGPHCIVDPTGRAKSISLSRFFGIANQSSHCLKRQLVGRLGEDVSTHKLGADEVDRDDEL